MIPARFFHSPSAYVQAVERLEPLLACLTVLLFAVAFYLMRHGIARCYRQAYDIAEAISNRPAARPAVRGTQLPARESGDAGKSADAVNLYSCLEHTGPGSSRLAKKIKLTVRSFVHHRHTQRWLEYWNLTPAHTALARATPRLLQKIYRPYQSLRLRQPERLEVLISHYDFIFQQGLAPLVLKAAQLQMPVGSFIGKSGDVYEVRLAAISSLDREGELALHLYRDQQHLFSTAFTFYKHDVSWCVGIGCLQGPRGADARERIRRATRDMFGLRPKALMIRLVREIGHAYGCQRLVLVGNGNRVVNQPSKADRVHADYDHFWREIGAARRSDGDYEISCKEIQAAALADLPSKKRSEARRRISLAERAVDDVRRALACGRR
ncbi:MAG: hypothetical protein GAK35_03678 [Herbaspirillum frisingense]|uniref:DUF535 domain-containing protein n=1 Tax=Herbaspirillum frisingense TaxID=92645 RepID=A0A7V8FTS6_9BURK|nr:MAG: hypothetical protein GAK35_03678 [Herbaspirillum frisingense]